MWGSLGLVVACRAQLLWVHRGGWVVRFIARVFLACTPVDFLDGSIVCLCREAYLPEVRRDICNGCPVLFSIFYSLHGLSSRIYVWEVVSDENWIDACMWVCMVFGWDGRAAINCAMDFADVAIAFRYCIADGGVMPKL